MRMSLSLLSLGLALSTGAVAQGSKMLIGIDGSPTAAQPVWQINPNTGASVQVGTITGAVAPIQGLTYDAATDTLYATSGGSSNQARLYTIDRDTWVATTVGSYAIPGQFLNFIGGLAIDPTSNTLFGYESQSGALRSIDTATGASTTIGTMPFSGFGSIAWDSSAGALFAADAKSAGQNLWEIDPGTGGGTLVGPFNGSSTQIGVDLTWSSKHGLLGINNAGDDSLWSIDTATGAATLIGYTGTTNVLAIAYIPAPASITLLMAGGALAFRRRR